jgi:hypothetical protein
VTTADPGSLADEDGSPRPPTKVPGVWTQMPMGVRILLIALLVIAVGGIAVLSRTSLQSSADLDNGTVVLLTPTDGSNILQQDAIGIDLKTGYSASLRVNGTAIPGSQVRVVSFADEVSYRFEPGQGKVFTAWPAGKSCVDATYWKTSDGPAKASVEHWCFTVV